MKRTYERTKGEFLPAVELRRSGLLAYIHYYDGPRLVRAFVHTETLT